jgi:hypothetical protein
MMNAPFSIAPGEAIEREPLPIEIDPNPCQLCGLTIDHHTMIDHGEGPEFFCTDQGEQTDDGAPPWFAAAVLQPEIAEPSRPEPRRRAEPYRPAESTVQAFWYVTRNHDADYLARWLDKHPADRPHLFRIWKAKRCST